MPVVFRLPASNIVERHTGDHLGQGLVGSPNALTTDDGDSSYVRMPRQGWDNSPDPDIPPDQAVYEFTVPPLDPAAVPQQEGWFSAISWVAICKRTGADNVPFSIRYWPTAYYQDNETWKDTDAKVDMWCRYPTYSLERDWADEVFSYNYFAGFTAQLTSTPSFRTRAMYGHITALWLELVYAVEGMGPSQPPPPMTARTLHSRREFQPTGG